METKAGLRQYVTLISLFAVTSLALAFTVDIRITDEAGVRTSLPDSFGEHWKGDDVVFCHNKNCGRSWLQKHLKPDEDGLFTCPVNIRTKQECGGTLHPMSYGEWDNLPKDTVFFKKQYRNQAVSNQSVFVSVVLSGKDRSSIHRPQVCLVGQGNEIVTETIIEVPIAGQEPLEVMILDLIKKNPDGSFNFSYYAYWFVGKDRETAKHEVRMMAMGFDRIFRNVAHRWAYIAVSGQRAEPPEGGVDNTHFEEVKETVGQFYPKITLVESRLGS